MSKFVKCWWLVMSIVLVLAVGTGCSTRYQDSGGDKEAAAVLSGGAVQSHDGGNVVIDVEWVQSGDELLVFNVLMNTHSVNLDDYDLAELAVLRDDRGNEYRPLSWESSGAGHHLRGILTFPVPDAMKQGQADYFEIVIRDVADVEARVLRWEL